MSPYKVIFMGTPDFACASLQALHDHPQIEVPLVVTQPDSPKGRKLKLTPSPVKQKALELGLEVFDPPKISHQENYEKLQKAKPDLVIVLAYGQLLKQDLLDLFPDRFINIHASLLPRWRGAAPIQRALMQGDETTGVAYQVMRLKLDSGPVIHQEGLKISENMDSVELASQLSILAAQTLGFVVESYLKGELKAREQNEKEITYAKKISKEESRLDWTQTAQQIHNQVRGLQWGPGAYTHFRGKRLKISRTCVNQEKVFSEGGVGEIEEHILWVGTSLGSLGVEILQPEGKPKMKVTDFVNGYQVKEGDKFE